MLPKPKLLQIPNANMYRSISGGQGCATHSTCGRNYICDPYGSNCIDATYEQDDGCSWTLGSTIITIGVTVGVGIITT